MATVPVRLGDRYYDVLVGPGGRRSRVPQDVVTRVLDQMLRARLDEFVDDAAVPMTDAATR
jgi:hypothetical protein